MPSHSPFGHYGASIGRSRSEGDVYSPPVSPGGSLAVSSTSPPSVPKLPQATHQARPAPSILRNPLSPEQQRKANSPPGILKALPGRRRPSVVVEVVHSPPPPGFDSPGGGDSSSGVDDTQNLSRISSNDLQAATPQASSSGAFAGPSGSGGGSGPEPRSRSMSPMAIPGARGSADPHASTSSSSNGGESAHRHGSSAAMSSSVSSVLTDSSMGSARSDASSVKFAPLPPGRRAHRSNSLTIGVASRAKMIQAQGGTPNVRTARYAGPQLWYEGGAMPDDVYTWKDAQKGLQKLFKRGKSDKGKEVATEGDETPRPERGRSASVSSVTSSNDADEARRMELEAKGKVREIEHIEEAIDEDDEEEEGDDGDAARLEADIEDNVVVKFKSPGGPASDTSASGGRAGSLSDDDDDDEGTSASEVTSPRTPPDGLLQLGGVSPTTSQPDADLETERRRVMKGKGKAVDDAEHGEVRVAS